MRHQAGAEQLFERRLQFALIVHQHHAAGLAAAAGMHLGLDHPVPLFLLFRMPQPFLDRMDDLAGRHGDAIALKQRLGLIFVQIHKSFSFG